MKRKIDKGKLILLNVCQINESQTLYHSKHNEHIGFIIQNDGYDKYNM